MSDTLASLRRKLSAAEQLGAVVRAMKAVAASSIGQYEKAVEALGQYQHSVELGILPAVDVAKSVSRVGSAAQRAPYRAVAGDLKLAYSQFEELETFSRFGTRLDEHTRQVIGHGQRIRACLGQPQFAAVPVAEQIALLQALTGGLLDSIPLDRIAAAEEALRAAIARMPSALRQRYLADGTLDAADRASMAQIVAAALAPFKP